MEPRSPVAESAPNRLLVTTRTLGALALLLIGAIHFQQYHYDFYSAIPTIGTLFLLNFIGGTGLGLFLLAPFKPPRLRRMFDQMTAVAGIGFAVSGIAALLVSEHTPLFGFMEHGYRFVIVLTLAAEGAAAVLLAVFLVCTRQGARSITDQAGGGCASPAALGASPCAPVENNDRHGQPTGDRCAHTHDRRARACGRSRQWLN